MFSVVWKKQHAMVIKTLNSVITKQAKSFPYDGSITQGLVLLKKRLLPFLDFSFFFFLTQLKLSVYCIFDFLNDERDACYPRCF